MHVLIVGFGYVGSSLARRLLNAGHQVVGLKRTPKLFSNLPKLHLVAGDLHSEDTLKSIPQNISDVVYAASPGERCDEAYRRAYPEGVARILDHLENARFTFISSTSVYAQSKGELVNDESPALSDSFSAKRLRQAENLVTAQHPYNLVLRSSGIYGPQRTSLVSRLQNLSLDDETRAIWTNRIHRDDLAKAIHFLLDLPKAGGTFIVSDSTPSQLGTLQDWIRSQPENSRLPLLKGTRPAQRKNRRLKASRLHGLDFSYHYPSFKEGYRELFRNLERSATAQE